MSRKQKRVLFRIIISAILVLLVKLLPLNWTAEFVLMLIPYAVIGYDILIKAFRGVINLQPFDENFLMAAATVGAMLLDDSLEGTSVMLLYQIGELFQSCALGKSRKSIAELMDIRPDYANVETPDGEITVCDPYEVNIGSRIVIKPGERVPIDGVVVEGTTMIDTSALTGESVPRELQVGDNAVSGSINLTGLIKIKTTREFGESTASKIIDLVENASANKSRSENFISKFARYYTPIVCLGALLLALIPPIAIMLFTDDPADWVTWVYRALTFLVVSCPCALVISIPLSFFAGIGGASREGILIKGSNYIETISKVKCAVFDKTGTLTKGSFEVTEIYAPDINESMLLEYAALAESYSEHPISESVLKAYAKKVDRSRVKNVKELGGHGVIANVDGRAVCVGNIKLMIAEGVKCEKCTKNGTVLYVSVDGKYAGHILISDVIKPQSADAVATLKKVGVTKTVMLTGDVKEVGNSVAESLNIDEVYAELLPADKVSVVEAIIARIGEKGKLAFVGDGINDAPVLTRADVGIAMGALGSDAAIEAADIVLMDDDPLKVSKAIRISKKCMRIVYQNIYFAIGIKLGCLVLAAVGIANMWLAIFADVGVMVIAVLNAIRSLNVKKV